MLLEYFLSALLLSGWKKAKRILRTDHLILLPRKRSRRISGFKKIAHRERYDDVIYIKFGFQSNKRMRYRVMKTGNCGMIARKDKPLVLNIGDNWRLTAENHTYYDIRNLCASTSCHRGGSI